jgi:hypothetical protein
MEQGNRGRTPLARYLVQGNFRYRWTSLLLVEPREHEGFTAS